jgi:predicted DNA-binding WGR domain protein
LPRPLSLVRPVREGVRVQKLYKRTGGALYYHEAWASGSKIIEHWGVAGDRGQTTEHRLPKKADPESAMAKVLGTAVAQGYVPVDEIGEATLLIEYAVEGFGTPADLKKRQALEERMNETLGWTGLGNCDGGSIGSGTMEVCCIVVDFVVAKRVIEADLAGTKFADFTRIYDENAEPGTAADLGNDN